MQLERLRLLNFRNYPEADIPFSKGVHIIHGENGAGKTSILEAIYYLALTKSFRTSTDKHLILNQEKMFSVQGDFITSQGQALHVVLGYSKESGKRLTTNGQKAQKFSEFIGEVPIVLLHPADLNLSQGGPQQRRRFLDILLSQSSKVYLHHLIQYNRSLKQRNQLLASGMADEALFASWEENLATHGAMIVEKRRETVERLSDMVKQGYCELSNRDEKVKIVYQSNIPEETEGGDLLVEYRALFAKKRSREIEYGTTMVGPHRDDLLFLINGKPTRAYASQGEHKTFVIALKLAEYQYLREQQSHTPILLFDDIFGELDAQRIRQMLEQLSDIGQVFVTTTSQSFFEKVQNFSAPTHYYQVKAGKITPEMPEKN